MKLLSPRLVLRRWQERDREPLFALHQHEPVRRFLLATGERAEVDQLFDRIVAHWDRHGFGLFAAEHASSGDFLGFVGLLVPSFEAHFTPCVEIAWRLDPRVWGQGYATEGARETLEFAFSTLGLGEIVSMTVPANVASWRVMEKLGMERSGEFDHPRVPADHALRRHLLYRLPRGRWEEARSRTEG